MKYTPHALKHLAVLGLALSLVVIFSGQTYAQGYLSAPESQKRKMGIYFTGLDNQSCSTGGGGQSGVTPATTSEILLPEAITTAVTQNRTVYEAVGASRDVPWQIIAALHFREFNMKSDANPTNGQGVYQLYSLYQNGERFPAGPINEAEFKRQTEMATDFFLGKQGSNLANHRARITRANADPDTIKDTFYSYNGRSGAYASQATRYGFSSATQPYEGSPYVMNQYDAARQSMPMITSDGGTVDGTDTRPGAYTVYAGLLGLGGGGAGATCTQGTGNPIADAAKAEYDKGVKEVPPGSDDGPYIEEYTEGNPNPWSPDFVSWVYNKAGSAFTGGSGSDWHLRSVTAISSWLRANGQYTTRQEKTFEPQPGDVLVIAQDGDGEDHVGIVYSISNNAITTIEGNVTDALVIKTYNNYATNARIVGWGKK